MSLPASVEKFFTQLRAEIDKHVSPDEAAQVDHFAHILYQRYPFTETVGRSVIDLFGNAYGSWKFVQKLDRQRPKIRIFNPDYEQHGWVSNSTIVAVLSRDMPFIRDSIRAEFHRRGIAIHQIYAALYTAERNAEGQLEAIYARAPDDVDDSNGEVLLYLEVARHSDSLAL
jgi:glutamate dehydrogenase